MNKRAVDIMILIIACIVALFFGIMTERNKTRDEYYDAMRMWDVIDESCKRQGKKAVLKEILIDKDEMLYETTCE